VSVLLSSSSLAFAASARFCARFARVFRRASAWRLCNNQQNLLVALSVLVQERTEFKVLRKHKPVQASIQPWSHPSLTSEQTSEVLRKAQREAS